MKALMGALANFAQPAADGSIPQIVHDEFPGSLSKLQGKTPREINSAFRFMNQIEDQTWSWKLLELLLSTNSSRAIFR